MSTHLPDISPAPVEYFSPTPGITVSRTGTAAEISGRIELSGDAANEANAASIQRAINTNWTHDFADGYSIRCNVSVRYLAPGMTKSANALPIEADSKILLSHADYLTSKNKYIKLNPNEIDAFNWTPAHEFAHILNMRDRYFESRESAASGFRGGPRVSVINKGYEGNLLGEFGGTLNSQNLKDLIAENSSPAPRAQKIRAWAAAHTPAEIGALSTTLKLEAIHALMPGEHAPGVASPENWNAAHKICDSMGSEQQADAIRAVISKRHDFEGMIIQKWLKRESVPIGTPERIGPATQTAHEVRPALRDEKLIELLAPRFQANDVHGYGQRARDVEGLFNTLNQGEAFMLGSRLRLRSHSDKVAKYFYEHLSTPTRKKLLDITTQRARMAAH